MARQEVDTAWNSYLGQCKVCKKFGAVGGVSDTCAECKMKRLIDKEVKIKK